MDTPLANFYTAQNSFVKNFAIHKVFSRVTRSPLATGLPDPRWGQGHNQDLAVGGAVAAPGGAAHPTHGKTPAEFVPLARWQDKPCLSSSSTGEVVFRPHASGKVASAGSPAHTRAEPPPPVPLLAAAHTGFVLSAQAGQMAVAQVPS